MYSTYGMIMTIIMTIMTTTMIPCGAKLPIIALVFGALAGGDYASVCVELTGPPFVMT